MKIQFKKIKKPQYKIIVKETEKYLWPLFHPHHYMTANKSIIDSLPRSSKFFTFYWLKDDEEILIGCLGVLNQISNKPARRITRLVVLPEFQGLGFSKIMLNNISELYMKEGIIMYITTFHPRLGSFFENSKNWAPSNNNMKEFRRNDIEDNPLKNSLRDGLAMYRYHYIGETDYEIIYNPLTLTELESKITKTDENDKEYKKLKKEILKIQRAKDPNYKEPAPEETKINNPDHLKRKEEHNKIFKKPRNVLSASERKAKRDELRENKNLKIKDTNED